MYIAGSRHAKTALQGGTEIRDDIAEHIICDDYFILIGLEHHPHSDGVYELRVRLYIRIACCYLCKCSLPEVVPVAEHVRFIGHRDALAIVLFCVLEGCDDDPLYAPAGVDIL